MDDEATMCGEQCGHEWPADDGTHSCVLRGGHHRHVPHLCWCAERLLGSRVELSEREQR